jgi:hypothetical protein
MALSPKSAGLSFGASASKSTTNESGTFSKTTTPVVPEWGSSLVQGVAGRVGDLMNRDPQGLVAPAHELQLRAAGDTFDLGGYDGNYGMATDLARGAADTSWLQPHLNANTPFASGGKAYDYVDRYLNPYLNEVVDSSAADFDANAGQVRAQQALDLAGSGAFGGSGAALTQSMTEGELARGRASTLSGLRSRAFEQALGAAAGDADRATQARMANAQTALQDRAQKVGLGFQAQGQQLNAANQLGDLASGLDANRRANIAARASMGDTLRGIDQAERQAPVTSTEQIVAMLNGLPLNLFVGQQENGSSTSHSTTKGKSVNVGGNIGFG